MTLMCPDYTVLNIFVNTLKLAYRVLAVPGGKEALFYRPRESSRYSGIQSGGVLRKLYFGASNCQYSETEQDTDMKFHVDLFGIKVDDLE